jgi:hypothetical protein
MTTAIEWLYETLWKQNDYSLPSNILEAAKEMEKQQIIKSYHEGQLIVLHIIEESLTPLGFDSTSDKEDKEDAIDYYNETFNTTPN